MDIKKLLLGTLVGTITSFIVAFLIFGVALKDYMAENASAIDPPRFQWLILAHIIFALLTTIIFLKWAGIKTAASGAKAGFLIGILVALGSNFIWLGTSDLFTGGLTTAILDAVGGSLIWAAGGAGVGWILGRD